ncbi:MAG: hypothetical protein R3300_15825 [Candidatus Promineifilaceae bacterium]|nr:hypothetical protein [Candidatus Promineifilaceae bacterium]
MATWMRYGLILLLLVHALIHLMGFLTYSQLAEIEGLPYKTTVLAGRVDLGESGTRLFGAAWLAVAVGFLVVAIGLALQGGWWQPALAVMAVVSIAIILLDWQTAYFGALLDVLLLAGVTAATIIT